MEDISGLDQLGTLASFIDTEMAELVKSQEEMLPDSPTGLVESRKLPIAYHISTGKILAFSSVQSLLFELMGLSEDDAPVEVVDEQKSE